MNTKKTQKSKPSKPKVKIRTNTPRQRGEYKSYSIRILKRDLDKLQKLAKKQRISANTWIVDALMLAMAPAPVPVEEIDDPSKYRVGMEVADGEALQS